MIDKIKDIYIYVKIQEQVSRSKGYYSWSYKYLLKAREEYSFYVIFVEILFTQALQTHKLFKKCTK